ncbi:hypothetical protein VTJ83DRAFT_2188 [Remersonia thermophila]|uniref:Sugar phosphate transporter domain-containing protein n=1 Tax=Remersonia thermophila TaxID=72144 RepID=A0ABR4DJ05_9PEZI
MSLPGPSTVATGSDPPPSSSTITTDDDAELLRPSTSDLSSAPALPTSSQGAGIATRSGDRGAPAPAPALAPPPAPTPAGPASDAAAELEMDAVTTTGHRRRRSSLINAPGASSASRRRSPRAATRSGLSPSKLSDDEDKIAEESSIDDVSLRPGEVIVANADDSDITDEDLHDDEEAGLTGRDRRRKQRKRRRNQQLDQRVAGDVISPEEKKEADRNVARRLLVNVVLIGLWYFFSLLISLYNKWMFSPDKLNFRFPMFTTACHFLVQFTLASLVLLIFPSMRPKHGRSYHDQHHPSDLSQSRHEPESDRPIMSKTFYLTRIGPCGLATGLDIGLGNTSLQFITLTFYTMCKSSSLAFVLLFAFLFRLESPTWKLVGIIATMTLGVVMMVAGEVEFQLGGFILVISAAFFSGFRWALTQILLLRHPATSNPFSSIFFLAPVMFAALISIAIPVEGPSALLAGIGRIADEKGLVVAPLILLFPGIIAFLMTAAEFALLQRTSVVTLSIAGIFKEAVTITAAAIVFGDTMTFVNIIGLLTTLVAIATYNYIKIAKMRADAQKVVHRDHLAQVEVLSVGRRSRSFSRSRSRSRSHLGGRDERSEDVALLERGRTDDNSDVLFTAGGEDMVAAARDDAPPARDRRLD